MTEDSGEDDLRHAQRLLESMLVPGESILALAIQRRLFALTHRRVMVAATSGRLIGFSRGLIAGFTPADLRWQDLKSVHVQAGIWASDLTIVGLSQPDLASEGAEQTLIFDGLRKDEAQAVYRICQAHEQAWREKRRLRGAGRATRAIGGMANHCGFHPSAQYRWHIFPGPK